LLASVVPGGFDVTEAARLELDWWQARREAVSPRDYGVTVGRVAAITYGKRPDDPALLESGVGRAEAMAYRDARAQAMAEQDWLEIEGQLLRAYQQLRTAIAGD
jgi:hypothetical protein